MHGISRASWLSCILAVFGFGKLVRADPVEARKDFVGYHAEGDGTYKAVFCPEGETATSIGTMFDCCLSGGSCRFGTGCSAQYQMITMLETPASGKTTSLNCLLVTSGNSCVSKFVYQDLIETRDPLVWVGCRDQLGITKSASYYRKTASPVAAATTDSSPRPTTRLDLAPTSLTPPGTTATIQGPGTTSPYSHTISSGTKSPTIIDTITETLAAPGSPIPSETATSSSTLSPGDKIAIGVGIGVGLPTVLIGLLAWLFPRNRWRGERVRAVKRDLVEMSTSDREEE